MATQSEVAAHLDLSQPAISQLVAAGILPAPAGRGGLDLAGCRVAYVRHLREMAAGRASEADGLDIVAERARLASAQADAQEMKNEIARGATVLVDDVAAIVAADYAKVRTRLLSVPSERAAEIHRCRSPAAVQSVLSGVIHEALAELSAGDDVAAKCLPG